MWHEARRQERKIRGIMVDLKRRAERRKEYFDRIKRDPAEFLQVWGSRCKLYLDPAGSAAAQTMTAWSADPSVQIDRFDIRAHLDSADLFQRKSDSQPENDTNEERMCNYERYRLLVQNDVTGITERQCLEQIALDEKFGCSTQKPPQHLDKKSERKAEIHYSYGGDCSGQVASSKQRDDEDSSVETEYDTIDLDLVVNVEQLTEDHKHLFNVSALKYGMCMGDYTRMLSYDKEEMDAMREQRMIEAEKAQFSGRKARRERRLAKEKRVRNRDISPISYITRLSPQYEIVRRRRVPSPRPSRSPSRSPFREKTTFITSYGSGGTSTSRHDESNVPARNLNITTAVKRSSSIQNLRNLVKQDDEWSDASSRSKESVSNSRYTVPATSSTSDTEEEEVRNYQRRKEQRKFMEKHASAPARKMTAASERSASCKVSHQEELKRKTKALLKRQVRKDRKDEERRFRQIEKEKQQRDADIKEMTAKLRQRRRKLRSPSKCDTNTSEDSDLSRRSRSRYRS